jgi:predicted transcriptional regulator
MGQQEITDFLRVKRQTGDHSYFTVHEIAKGLNGGSIHYSAIRRSLYQLCKMGIVEAKTTGDVFEWVKTFRLHKKYCAKPKKAAKKRGKK